MGGYSRVQLEKIIFKWLDETDEWVGLNIGNCPDDLNQMGMDGHFNFNKLIDKILNE